MVRRRVPIGLDADGKPIMKQVKGKSEYDAMKKAGQIMLLAGLLDEYLPEQMRDKPKLIPAFGELAERWYKVNKANNPKLKPGTKTDYRRILDKYLLPVLGRSPTDKITPTGLQELLKILVHEGMEAYQESRWN